MTLKRKNLRVFGWTLLLFSICFLVLPAQEKQVEGKSFLWKVEGKGGTSYLLGSVHMLKKEHFPLKPAIEKAFAATDALAVEADLSPEKAMSAASITFKMGMYTGDDTFKNHVSEKTYNLVKEWMDSKGQNVEAFLKLKPWLLSLTITAMQLAQRGFNPEYGIDMYFIKKASGVKEILELEGAEFQAKLFDGFSDEENEQFLFSTIQEVSASQEEFDGLVNAWLTGDAGLMEKLVTKNIDKFPELKKLYKVLLDDRNVGMAEKVDAWLKEGRKLLVIAGAAHMVGSKGLVQLLKDKGYSLKQL